jgi:hypothetical protein
LHSGVAASARRAIAELSAGESITKTDTPLT